MILVYNTVGIISMPYSYRPKKDYSFLGDACDIMC